MNSEQLAIQIAEARPRPGRLAAWWLYQAGLVLKSSKGTVVAIDLYLSDVVARTYNQPRAVTAPLQPTDLKADAILATHSHDDHLDPESVADLLRSSATALIGPPMALAKAAGCGVKTSQMTSVRRGDTVQVGDISVLAVHARHEFAPEPTPDAVGFVIQTDDIRLYHSGDTEYDSRILEDTKDITASFVSINGTTSNMSAYEAALLAWRQGARVAFPMHYGLWRDADYGSGATLDPLLFVETHQRLVAGRTAAHALILQPGRMIELSAEGLCED